MEDALGKNYEYHLSKLYELMGTADREVIRKLHFEHLKSRIEDFERIVIEKYGSLDEVIGIKHKLENINYTLDRIENYFTTYSDEKEISVMVYALSHMLKDLDEMAIEIDE